MEHSAVAAASRVVASVAAYAVSECSRCLGTSAVPGHEPLVKVQTQVWASSAVVGRNVLAGCLKGVRGIGGRDTCPLEQRRGRD